MRYLANQAAFMNGHGLERQEYLFFINNARPATDYDIGGEKSAPG